MESILRNHSDKQTIINNIKGIPLNRMTIQRRATVIADNIRSTIKDDVQKSLAISLCIDESTDINDNAQLIAWTRYVDEDLKIYDHFLDISALKNTTKAQDIFEVLKQVLSDYSISFENVSSITTDGAASMTGKKSGVAALMKNENKLIKSIHCIIHQESLIAKLGIPSAKPTADKVMTIINKLISAGALRHRQFKIFLEENESPISDMSKMQQVRWLSVSKVLNQFITLVPLIKEFLFQLKQPITFDELEDQNWIEQIAFLADITQHLSILNQSLQGNLK